MNQNSPYSNSATALQEQLAEDAIDVERLVLIARRQGLLVAVFAFIGFCIAVVYALNAQPLFSASTNIILGDTAAVAQADQRLGPTTATDTLIAGQIELLRSTRIATKVVDQVGVEALDVPVAPSLTSQLKSGIKSLLPSRSGNGEGDAIVTDPRLAAAINLQKSITIQRVGRSPVISISFTSPDPQIAARVPNAYAKGYLEDQKEAMASSAAESRQWLQEQVQSLRQELFEAELAVEEFRGANGLAQPGGQLISERMIIDLGTQIAEAMSELGLVTARAEQISGILNGSDPDRLTALPADVLVGDTGRATRSLRDDLVTAESRLAEIVARSGADHPEAKALTIQIDRLKERLIVQLEAIHQQVLDAADVASRRVGYLNERLEAAVERNVAEGHKLIELSNLEHFAEGYRALFRSYVNQYQQTALQNSAPRAIAQVISPANRPIVPVSPNKIKVALAGLLLGLLAGVSVAALREYRERYYRIGDQLVDDLTTEFLGSIPTARRAKRGGANTDQETLFKSNEPALRLWSENLNSDTVETLRRTMLTSELWARRRHGRRKKKVIGIISALPDEGKSVFAINLGSLLASSGRKTVVIDADFRKPGVAKALAVPPQAGLIELLVGSNTLEEVIMTDDASGLSVIPSLPNYDTPRTSQLLSSAPMDRLLDDLGETYDYVVIDLPPLCLVSDARALSSRIDGFFLVVRWGHTPRKVIRDTLFREPLVRAKLRGAVLNRVNLRRLRSYSPFGSTERYRGEYQGYGPPVKQ